MMTSFGFILLFCLLIPDEIDSTWNRKNKLQNDETTFFVRCCCCSVSYAWYFYVSTTWYDIFAHTKLHIDSRINIFYFEHIHSTPNCPLDCEWKMNCNSIDLVMLINIYVSSLCMVLCSNGYQNNKHFIHPAIVNVWICTVHSNLDKYKNS